jgi:hypothetical protein
MDEKNIIYGLLIVIGIIIVLFAISGLNNNAESDSSDSSSSSSYESDVGTVESDSSDSSSYEYDTSDTGSDSTTSGSVTRSEWMDIALDRGMSYSFASSFFDQYDYNGDGEWSYSEWSDANVDAQTAAYG